MAEITQPMSLATSTPVEAAKNIDGANAFNVNPDVFKEYKNELQPELDAAIKPQFSSPSVAKFAEKSTEHAALVAPDIEKMSYVEKQMSYIGDQINKVPTTERKINDLALKKMFHPEKVTQDDELQLFQLNEDRKGFSNYGLGIPDDPNAPLIDKALGFLETLPGQVFGQVRSTMDAVTENKTVVGTAIAGGAAIGFGGGAAAGLGVASAGTAPIGAAAGAISGTIYGVTAAMAIDGTNQQMGSTYNYLSDLTKADGTPLNIDEDTKRNISVGVGLATGALTAVLGKTVAKSVPFLEKYVSRKGIATLFDSTSAANKAILYGVGKSAAAGIGAGGLQETIRVFGEEIGKTYDGTEASFMSAIGNAGKILNENKGRITGAALVSGTTAAATTAIGGRVFRNRTIRQMEERYNSSTNIKPANPDVPFGGILTDVTPIKPKGGGRGGPVNPVEHAADAMSFKTAVENINKTLDTTEMKKLSPGQMFTLRKDMAQEAGIGPIYVDKDDLTTFADDPKKAEAIKNILSPEEQAKASANAPVQIEPHKFLELVDEYPNAIDLAKLNPEGPNAVQAKAYLESIVKAGEQRKEVLEKLGTGDITPEDKETLTKALETEQPFRTYPSNEVFGEAEYLKQPSIAEAMEAIGVPDGEFKRYNDAQQAARQSVVDNITDTATHEMDQIVDVTVREAMDAEYASQIERLEKNPNLAIVDKFTKTFEMKPDNRFDNPTVMTENHAKPGYSPLAIDPRLMTDEQKAQFLRDPQLRKHKAFVKGGISPNDSARLLGVNSGDNLLKILSETPSREQVAQYRTKQREADILANAKESVDLNKTALIQAYNDNTANHIAEMKYMLEKEWPSARAGFRRIALPLPKIESIRNRAESAVATTKIGNLNVNQFKVGERKSQRVAVDAIHKNQVEKAFVNKEAAALNSELARATHIATGKVNRVVKLARQFDKPENIRMLKDTGFDKAANEILDVFNLSSKRKGTAEQDAFAKHVEKQLKQGETVTTIPERLTDIRQSLSEMTVEQVLAAGDSLRNTIHLAKLKNRLFEKHEKIKALQTIEGYANALERQTDLNPNKSADKLVVRQDQLKDGFTKTGESLMDFMAMQRRAQNIIVELDNGKDVGLANDLIYQPIKKGNAANNILGLETNVQFEKIIEDFGKKDFENLKTQMVDIPEFKGLANLENGRMTKAELLFMNLNRGNEGNHLALERFGLTRDVFKKVIERELGDHKYMELTQRVWDMFKSFEPKIAALQKETEGNEVTFVKAEPIEFTANGETRVYPGGYYPIQTLADPSKNAAEKMQGSAAVNSADKFRQKFYAQAMTEQGHLEARTGNTAVLKLDLNGIASGLSQVIHDLTMRKPIRDVAKLLSDKKIRETIVKTVGQNGYDNLAQMVITEVNSAEDVSTKTDRTILGIVRFFGNNFSSAHLLLKTGTVLIQGASIPLIADRIGPKGSYHLSKAVMHLGKNITNMKAMYEFAENVHTPLKDSREDMEGDVNAKLRKLIPRKKWKGKLDVIRAGHEMIHEIGFGVLQKADNFNKVLAVHAFYSAAINGDVPGVEAGDHAQAAKYASNATEMTTTHSANRNKAPVQKNVWVKPFLMFYNDANILQNHVIDKAKESRRKFKESGEKADRGDYSGAFKAGASGAATIMLTMMTLSMQKLYENYIRGLPLPGDDVDDKGDVKQLAEKYTKFLLTAPIDNLVGTVPGARDLDYVLDYQKLVHRKQKLEPPPMKIGNTFIESITGINALIDVSEDARDVTDGEKKSFLYSAGYLTGLPADAIYKYLIKPDWTDVAATAKGDLQKLSDKISKFIKGNSDTATAEDIPADLLKEFEESSVDSIPPEVLQQLQQIQQEIDPNPAPVGEDALPPNTLDIIRQVESGGNWDAQNPNSTAAGLYQFIEGTWKDLMDRHPELGLTEDGRVSADTTQQQIAMQVFTEENVARLERNGVEATVPNIYAAHFLGPGKAVEVLSSPDTDKLEDLVGQSVMRANSFRKTMKVRDFKNWLDRKITRASDAIQDQASVDTVQN